MSAFYIGFFAFLSLTYSTASEFEFPVLAIQGSDFIGMTFAQSLEKILALNHEGVRKNLTPSLLIEVTQVARLLKNFKKKLRSNPDDDPEQITIIEGELEAICMRLRSITDKLEAFNTLVEHAANCYF